MAKESLPKSVARKIRYYVYLYSDPRNNKVFYVGKGKGQRAFAHLRGKKNSRKARIIRQLRRVGLSPRIEILAHGLSDDATALRIETAAIDLLGLDKLTNEVRGWESVELGRMPLRQLKAYYAPKPGTITEPAILIRINRLYKHGMSAKQLYDATRGVWKVGPRRVKAQLAFAIFEGVVQEIYKIRKWEPAGSTRYGTRLQDKLRVRGRWEFVGKLASPSLRYRYLGRDVSKYLRTGSQNPITYVNV